jgi:hypothetical protein
MLFSTFFAKQKLLSFTYTIASIDVAFLLSRIRDFITPTDNCLVKILNLNEPVGPQESPVFFTDFVQAFPDNFS